MVSKATVKRKPHATSGSEPSNRAFYNRDMEVGRNNCMAYAFGEKNRKAPIGSKQQPGNKSGNLDHVNLSSCSDIVHRIMQDYKGRVYRLKKENMYSPCKKGYAKVQVAIAPNRDFHFYRQERDGYWTHKRGLTPTSDRDACNKKIIDPLKSCRNFGDNLDYNMMCGTFCRKVDSRNRTNLKKDNCTKRKKRVLKKNKEFK